MRNSLSVKQLNNYIKNVFEDELVLQNITVTGEVFQISYSKYTFITLKEDDCVMQCVCFAHMSMPKVGQKAAFFGSVNYSEKLNRVSFIVKNMEILGDGLYQAEYLKSRENLRNKGYFDKKLPLPNFVDNVCIITSGYGSVIHDFLFGIADGHAYIKVTVFQSSVQGPDAENDIVENLKKADKNYDVVVLARGGGSAADMSCFNSEKVAAAVGEMHVPVISAIGHETDYTLCDLCASYRAGTPSFAAKKITDNNCVLIDKFNDCVREAGNILTKKLKEKSAALALLTSRTIFAASSEINNRFSDLRATASRFEKAAAGKCQNAASMLFSLKDRNIASASDLARRKDAEFKEKAVKLEYLNPIKILTSGYCVADKQGKTITSAFQLAKGDDISLTFSDGKVKAVVDNNKEA